MPKYNHTRDDSPFTPCDQCADDAIAEHMAFGRVFVGEAPLREGRPGATVTLPARLVLVWVIASMLALASAVVQVVLVFS